MFAEDKVSLAAEQVHPVLVEHDARLEALAKEIEELQTTAISRIAERLVEAREIFRYRRDEGGFGGWVETRLHYTRQTAYNLLHVYECFSGADSVKIFDTFRASILYLLAAPSTPEEARAEIIERAQAGESVSVAEVKRTIDAAKGRQPRFEHAKIFREMKLGADTVAALEGTTLASAREQDELVFLNRGAREGEHTEPVRDLVARAVRGEKVSAIKHTKTGRAFRGEKVSASNSESESECLRARIEELQAQLKHFENQNSALRRQVKDLQVRQKPVAPDLIATLSDAELTAGLATLEFERFLQVMPTAWRPKFEPRAGGRVKARHPNARLKNELKLVGGTEASPTPH